MTCITVFQKFHCAGQDLVYKKGSHRPVLSSSSFLFMCNVPNTVSKNIPTHPRILPHTLTNTHLTLFRNLHHYFPKVSLCWTGPFCKKRFQPFKLSKIKSFTLNISKSSLQRCWFLLLLLLLLFLVPFLGKLVNALLHLLKSEQ